jgi:rubrerythrin
MTSPAYPIMVQDQYMMKNLRNALTLIRQAVSGEREDELFYDYLISEALSDEDKKIIESIRNDERKHFKMFREIYYELTGQMLPPPTDTGFDRPGSYIEGIQKALFGELGAVERYRQILFGMQSRKHINMMTEIITDELKHASKYNFLYSKNKN